MHAVGVSVLFCIFNTFRSAPSCPLSFQLRLPPIAMSGSAGRRKRAAPKAQRNPVPVPVDDDPQPHRTCVSSSSNIPIAFARDAAAAAEATRPVDPPMTAVSPHDLATSVVARMQTQIPKRLPRSKTQVPVPTAALEALVQEVATAALDALTAGWTRVVAAEADRRKAATAMYKQRADVAGQWNLRSRPVAVLGAPGLGFGRHVLPFLRRSEEGRALHATSVEIRGACRRAQWSQEVRRRGRFYLFGCSGLCS